MQLHQISPRSQYKKAKRVGRGGKKGTFSGRGVKGQKSRAGANLRPGWRDLIKQFPKKRGFKFRSIYAKQVPINLGIIDEKFKSGEIVSPKTLLAKGLAIKRGNRMPEVKILGTGETKKKLTIKDCLISASAREKIEKAGGLVK